jgi:hypothetical protein
MSRETSELGDLLDLLDRPKAVTLSMVAKKANEYTTREEFGKSVELLLNRSRLVVTKFEDNGYRHFRNNRAADGRWKIDGRWHAVYVLRDLSEREAHDAVKLLGAEAKGNSGKASTVERSSEPRRDEDDIPF